MHRELRSGGDELVGQGGGGGDHGQEEVAEADAEGDPQDHARGAEHCALLEQLAPHDAPAHSHRAQDAQLPGPRLEHGRQAVESDQEGRHQAEEAHRVERHSERLHHPMEVGLALDGRLDTEALRQHAGDGLGDPRDLGVALDHHVHAVDEPRTSEERLGTIEVHQRDVAAVGARHSGRLEQAADGEAAPARRCHQVDPVVRRQAVAGREGPAEHDRVGVAQENERVVQLERRAIDTLGGLVGQVHAVDGE